MTIASPRSRNRPGHSGCTATGPACSCLTEQQSVGPIYNRSTPFPARLITNRTLSGPGSAKETRHFELSLSGSGITYEAGDSVGVWPTNCPALVNDIVSALGCDGEEAVAGAQGRQTSLRTALLRDYQLTQAPLNLLRVFAERSQDAQLNDLLQPENKAHLEEFLSGLEVIDLLLTLPSVKFTPQEFTGLLRKMQPRLYSISSSPKAHPDEVHLTVAVVRYESLSRQRQGVCSTFLADRVGPDTPVPVFVQPSRSFRLPADGNAPVIMIGPGTGIAPFRAFLEERRATGARGRNWLFFGDQHRSCDFLYWDDLKVMLADGTLNWLDTAFSRDQPEKVYVQDRMLEFATEFWIWLEAGAHVYVCGDAKRMARDVDATLRRVIEAAGGKTAEAAAEYVRTLKRDKRYLRDVY